MLAASAPIVVHVDSGTDWSTLAIAIIGTALAIAGLAWQWYSTMLTGARIKVEIRRGLRAVAGVITFDDDTPDWQIDQARQQGYTDPVYAVRVNNTGRGETSITRVELEFSDAVALQLQGQSPPRPHRMIGESEAVWYFEGADVHAAAAASKAVWPDKAKNLTVRGKITLGSTKTAISRNRLAV